jgi:nucleolar MIF4G domain-containing protein 1
MHLCSNHLNDHSISLILQTIHLTGPILRSDAPTELVEFMSTLHSRASVSEQGGMRYKFMMEQLDVLKNNKKWKFGQQEREAMDKLRQVVRRIVKRYRAGGPSEPLGCSLEDIRSVPVKGKWWVVGAAWRGRQHGDVDLEPLLATGKSVNEHEERVLALARRFKINTDVRRAIFVILMTSEDYVEAWERLSQLKLKDQQEREIVRMLVFCCGKVSIFLLSRWFYAVFFKL